MSMRDPMMATFNNDAQAVAAATDLLNAGFLNVEHERSGGASLVVVDPGERAADVRRIFAAHGGVEL
ncbi:MAG TPA: hypothetical protein VGK33_05925 [Chloroflexota bacterium]